MIQPNIEYLAFDDRRLMIIAIPIIAFGVPFVFFGLDMTFDIDVLLRTWAESLAHTLIFWLLNRLVVIRLRQRYNVFSQSLKRFIIQIVLLILIFPWVALILGGLIELIYYLLNVADPLPVTLLQSLGAVYVLTFAITMLYEVIFFLHKYKEAITEKNMIQLAHVQSQLDNLRNKINPHLLFNSLNTLMSLIPTEPKIAMSYLDKLSKFYRYTVSHQEEKLVDLSSELNNAEIYLSLLKERFQDGIHIELPQKNIPSAKIPPSSLQLLIENAVKHNIVSVKYPLQITISISQDREYLIVKNNIQKKNREIISTGMGLSNIKDRLSFYTDKPVEILQNTKYFKVSIPLIFLNTNHEDTNHRR